MLGLSEERIEQVLEGIDSIDTTDEEKALLHFCVKASKKENYKILKEEIDALKNMGYSDVQVIEAVAITGYFNYINTLSNVFALGE
jgi:alkylhydroperoxidase family enzyme